MIFKCFTPYLFDFWLSKRLNITTKMPLTKKKNIDYCISCSKYKRRIKKT